MFVTSKWKLLIIIFIVIIKQSLQHEGKASESQLPIEPNVQAHFEKREVHSISDLNHDAKGDHLSTKAVISITDFDVKLILDYIMTSHDAMIQADIEKGNHVNEQVNDVLKTGNSSTINYENTTFQDLINKWKKTNKKLKLHFKSTDAFMSAIPTMKSIFETFDKEFQPWLCGDILVGPGPGDSPSIDAHTFIKNAKEKFPDSMLSLGWTTKKRTSNDENNETNDKYTMENVKEMIQVLDDVKYTKVVNYVVRASYAANSLDELLYLLDHDYSSTDNSTLTIVYNDQNDIINYPKLVEVIRDIGLTRVYLDVPNNVSVKLFDHFYRTNNEKKISSVIIGAERAGSDWDFGKTDWKMFNM
ncbi:Protein of unknown function DUF2181 [Cinara cedri]|uniref:Menorin-like domain-containing protein n=1 Tax=Cinara cedri TaxID=506608 RepID=A0A5E4MD60_9HEMI|nr:Protein of unknown function DUF2181 [Cinara cedri]